MLVVRSSPHRFGCYERARRALAIYSRYLVQNPFARSVRYRHGLPVLPGAFPVVGHIPVVYRDLPAVLRKAKADHGPMFWITLGLGTWALLCTGEEGLACFRSPAFSSAHL